MADTDLAVRDGIENGPGRHERSCCHHRTPPGRAEIVCADMEANRDADRVARLLEHEDPDSDDYALVRFAAEKVVADRPDAALAEHEWFMDAKLDQARLVRDGLERLAALNSSLEGLAEAAASALRRGRFEEVDTVLARAEESHEDTEVRVFALSVRAETAFVTGDASAAAAHFVAAADYLVATDTSAEEEVMLFRRDAVRRLIRHADTFGGDGGWIDAAMELCNANIQDCDTHAGNQGARQMDAGNAQLSAGRLKDAPESLDLFLAAEYAFRIASWRFREGGFPGDWAAAQNGRGLAEAHFCFRFEEAMGQAPPEGSWAGAEESYRSALEVQGEAGLSVQWAKTRINLGYLLLRRGCSVGGETGLEFLRRSIEECREVQRALRPEVETDVWVDAQQIVAEAMLECAEIDPDEAMDHLSQAMIELTTAKDHLAGEDLPLRVASVDRLMARLRRKRERLDEA